MNTLVNEKSEKAVILARVSSKEQRDEGYSLPAQQKLLSEYAENKNILPKKTFQIAETASKDKQRYIFQQMMEYIEQHNIKILICEKVDRLVRNFKDTVMIDEWLEADEERQVHFVKDSLILHKKSRSQEKLNWGMRVVIAKNYIDNLREEVAKGQIEKLEQGWLPGTPTLGYINIGEVKHKIQAINGKIAPLIKLTFELYDSGNYSIQTLAIEMENQGLRNRKDKVLSKSQIHRILRNSYYIGKITWLNTVYDGKHPHMVSDELFQRVQERLSRPNAPKYSKHNPLFKGMLKCSECKGTITWERQKGNWYGHCNGYKNCTKKKWVREELVEEQLLKYFDDLQSPTPALVAWVKKELKSSHQEEIDVHNASLNQLGNRYNK